MGYAALFAAAAFWLFIWGGARPNLEAGDLGALLSLMAYPPSCAFNEESMLEA